MYHYVYKLEHIETGEYYFGSRTSKLHPTNDTYFGSMKVWKPDKKLLFKTIIRDDFQNREDAIELEQKLICEHIGKPLNRNYNVPGRDFYVHQELFNNTDHQQGSKNSQFGTCWIHNINGEFMKIKKDEPLPDGWFYGRTLNPKPKSSGRGHKGEVNSQFGTCWITNGEETKKIKKYDDIPTGWRLGCINKKMRGHRWITNGIENRRILNDTELPVNWYYGKVQKKYCKW